MTAGEKLWFRRGQAGIGYRPQTWQGWISLAVFLVILGGSVELAQALMADNPQGQTVTFIIAAIEIMGFMRFVRGRAAAPPEAAQKR